MRKVFFYSLFVLLVSACSASISPVSEPYAWKSTSFKDSAQALSFIEKRLHRLEVDIAAKQELLDRYFYRTSTYQPRIRKEIEALNEEKRALEAEKERLLKA